MGLHISNVWASRLLDATTDLTIVGLERSAKFSYQSLNWDRFIIGPQHSSFTTDQLSIILNKLQFPRELFDEVLQQFECSNQSGMGFEQKNGVSSYRFYLEFFDGYKPDPSLNRGLLHLGYKWQCDDPAKLTITRYHYAPAFNGNNPERVIQDVFALVNRQFVNDNISATAKAIQGVKPEERIMSYAVDGRGCRRSYTVKIYKSKKNVNYIRPELESISRFFDINQSLLENFLSTAGSAALGHLAGGLDVMNDPFFTVYFDDFYQFIKMYGNITV